MQNIVELRFDHLLREALLAAEEIRTLLRRRDRIIRNLRRSAYRFARCLVEMQGRCHNELVDFLSGQGKSISSFIDENFEPLEDLRDCSRREIESAIKNGISEDDFVRHGSYALVKRKHKTKNNLIERISVPVPESDLSIEDAKKHIELLTKRITGLERDLRIAIKENDRLRNLLKKVRRDVTKCDMVN